MAARQERPRAARRDIAVRDPRDAGDRGGIARGAVGHGAARRRRRHCEPGHRRRQPPDVAARHAARARLCRIPVRLAVEDPSQPGPRSIPPPLARAVARRPAAAPAGTGTPWTCEIVWKRGRVWSRFQAVIVTSDDRKRRVVAESAGLRWPPKDVRNPPTRELEATLGTLVTSLTTTGWEPVPSHGSWSERRFVWLRPGEPPTRLRPGSGSSMGPARSRRAAGSHPLKPARHDRGGRLASPD